MAPLETVGHCEGGEVWWTVSAPDRGWEMGTLEKERVRIKYCNFSVSSTYMCACIKEFYYISVHPYLCALVHEVCSHHLVLRCSCAVRLIHTVGLDFLSA